MVVVVVDRLLPTSHLSELVVGFLASIDFHTTLRDGMLSFLLLAGALLVDWTEMRRARLPILVLSTVGVLLSTALVGSGSGFSAIGWASAFPCSGAWCSVRSSARRIRSR